MTRMTDEQRTNVEALIAANTYTDGDDNQVGFTETERDQLAYALTTNNTDDLPLSVQPTIGESE